jgi:hypothetical protein
MNADKLETAIQEAERFLIFAERALDRLNSDKYAQFGTKETAAARRASMDLTRALAQLRKTN